MDEPEPQDRRADLRRRLVEAAEAQIARHGLAGLKAREVTAAAGCALGALYNAVEDLDTLVLHVNSRTLARLGAALQQAAAGAGADPAARLRALARGYAGFATANRPLWAALFDHRMPVGRQVPDWHLGEHEALIGAITAPLSELRPDLDAPTLALRARTLFTAVHGVVGMAMQDRFVGVPAEALQAEVEILVDALCRGVRG